MDLHKFIGCMIGSAYGDSLGAAVEFLAWEEIWQQFGRQGITMPAPAYGQDAGVITDDTQLAIATAWGLVSVRGDHDEAVLLSMWLRYREWYYGQIHFPEQQRSPGTTTMAALASNVPGNLRQPLNYSTSCGAVMRAHPIGLAFAGKPDRAFRLGMLSGVMTHGHPDGYLPAAYLAALIAELGAGRSFDQAMGTAWELLHGQAPGAIAGTAEAIRMAMTVPPESNSDKVASRIDKTIGRTGWPGGGWEGNDALAIAIYALRCSPQDPLEAVRMAVNHSGDSDSTGAIAGAIIGAIHGDEPFATSLAANGVWLEHRDILTDLAQALFAQATNGHPVDASTSA